MSVKSKNVFVTIDEKLNGSLSRPLVYLASPYSDGDAKVRQDRADVVSKVAGLLLHKGYIVFSPISHSHPIALVCKMPTDWKFWETFCKAYLSVAHKLFVLTVPGWEQSVGVRKEMEIAMQLKIPIYFIGLGEQPEDLQPFSVDNYAKAVFGLE